MKIFAQNRLSKKDKQYYSALKKILGFKPRNLHIYLLALTHKSVTKEQNNSSAYNNERLEFLGDAALDIAVSDLLYRRFPFANEGFLTQMRTKIVNGETLTKIAKDIGLDKVIFVKSPGDLAHRVFEDAFEALIGAIYLDKGYPYVLRFVSKKILVEHLDLNQLKHINRNYKSQVIEWAQKRKLTIVFNTEKTDNKEVTFTSQLLVDNKVMGEGSAGSKKLAEQNAAQLALENIKKEGKF